MPAAGVALKAAHAWGSPHAPAAAAPATAADLATTAVAGAKGGQKKESKLGMSASKAGNFADWYSELVVGARLPGYLADTACSV